MSAAIATRDWMIVALITIYTILAIVTYLAWAYLRGFDPTMCEAYDACAWRYA